MAYLEEKKNALVFFLTVFCLIFQPLAFGAPVNTNSNGVALRGYDAVAYFTQHDALQGSPEFAFEWQGAKWYFTNASNRDLFAANPGKYAPQYGGFCAFAVSQGGRADADPAAWSIVDGKLYVNLNSRIRMMWKSDAHNYIQKADANWSKMK